jgi:hypothetical protein
MCCPKRLQKVSLRTPLLCPATPLSCPLLYVLPFCPPPPPVPVAHLSSRLRMSLRMLRTATLPSSPILATFLDRSLRRSWKGGGGGERGGWVGGGRGWKRTGEGSGTCHYVVQHVSYDSTTPCPKPTTQTTHLQLHELGRQPCCTPIAPTPHHTMMQLPV